MGADAPMVVRSPALVDAGDDRAGDGAEGLALGLSGPPTAYVASLPAPALRRHIARYWVLRGDFEHEQTIALLPDGGVHVVVHRGLPVRSENYGDPFDGHGPHLVGAMLRTDRQVLGGEQHIVGVTFRPGAFACFHRWDTLACAANRVQPFDRGFPLERVLRATQIAEVAGWLDAFYLERFAPSRASLGTIVEDIQRRGGQVRIDELMRRHAITGRSLERHFSQQVGIAPKPFIDLTRFAHAVAAVVRDRGRRTLTELALDCGYCDGAHLTNAFKRFTGQPPSRFILSDLSKSTSPLPDSVGA